MFDAHKDGDICLLCNRLLAAPCNKHHLLPLSKGGRDTETVMLHKICHDKIHSLFTEAELKRYYHTITRLQGHEEMKKFINWVQKREPGFYDGSVKKRK